MYATSLRWKLAIAVVVAAGVFCGGSAGYVYLEGWSLLDAVYMTAITLTSVGYQEVNPLSPSGRIFTIVLVICGYGILATMIGLVSAFLLEIEFGELRRRRKMEKQRQQLRAHYVVCGGGRIGERVIEEFSRAGVPFAVVETDESRLEALLEKYPDMVYVRGDATDEDVLRQARVEVAQGLLSTFPSDADNLFVAVSAKAINPNLRIISRATREETQGKLVRAGADQAILPNVICALRMASLALRPHVVSFLDVMIGAGEITLNLEEVEIPPDSWLVNKTLGEAHIPQQTGLIVIATKSEGDPTFRFNPLSSERIGPGHVLIVLGSREQTNRLRDYVLRA